MKLEQFKGKKVLLLGLAREGVGMLKYLKSHYPELEIGIADQKQLETFPQETKELLAEYPDLQLHLYEDCFSVLQQYDIVVRTPGITPRNGYIRDAVQAGVIMTSATNVFFSNVQGEVIVVTGTKGKSTTSSLLYEMLQQGGKEVELVGNIGDTAVSRLEEDHPKKLYVFEGSSYQLEDLQIAPHILLFINLFPDHLNYHGSLDAYYEAKVQVTRRMKEDDYLFYNAQFDEIRKRIETTTCHKVPFLGEGNANIEHGKFTYGGQSICEVTEMKLRGLHNASNIVAAFAVAKQYGVSDFVIHHVITTFGGLRHRLEFVSMVEDVSFYDDAISTTPESTIAAIHSFEQHIGTIILGGLDRGYDFEHLGKIVVERGIEHVILFPDSGVKIQAAIVNAAGESKKSVPTFSPVESMDACVKKAFEVTPKGSICLLSCASPSYSLFKNFEEKGDLFQQLVKSTVVQK